MNMKMLPSHGSQHNRPVYFFLGQNIFPFCHPDQQNFLPKFTYPKTLQKNCRPSGGINFLPVLNPKRKNPGFFPFLAEKFPGKLYDITTEKKTYTCDSLISETTNDSQNEKFDVSSNIWNSFKLCHWGPMIHRTSPAPLVCSPRFPAGIWWCCRCYSFFRSFLPSCRLS